MLSLYGILGSIGAVIVAIVGAFVGGHARGRASVQSDQAKQDVQNVQTARDVEQRVGAQSDAAVADDLRKHWTRN